MSEFMSNPPLALSRWVGNTYKKGIREQRDTDQAQLHHATIQMIAANYEATKRHTNQQARLTERAEQSKQNRVTEFFGQMHEKAEPGKPVSFEHSGVKATYTPKVPTAPKPGRVPVKKNRGGKRPR